MHEFSNCGLHEVRAVRLLMLLAVTLCFAASNSRFIGVWRCGPDPYKNGRSSPVVLTFTSGADSLTLRRESVTNAGDRKGSTFRYVFDGKYHPLEYPADAKHKKHTVMYRQVDERTLEFTIDHDEGKMRTTTRHLVSADGRTITESWTGADENGQPIQLNIVFSRAQE
jgi:hypothetical protein